MRSLVGTWESERQDAMAQSWAGVNLWLNPPFSLLEEVVDKVETDQDHGLLVMPDWPQRRWHKKAMSMSRGDLRFPRYTKLFELPHKACKGTLWPSRVVNICGHRPRCPNVLSSSLTIPRPMKRVHFDLRATVYLFPNWNFDEAHTWMESDREPEPAAIRMSLQNPKLAFPDSEEGPLFPPRRRRPKPVLPGDKKGRRRKRRPRRRPPLQFVSSTRR